MARYRRSAKWIRLQHFMSVMVDHLHCDLPDLWLLERTVAGGVERGPCEFVYLDPRMHLHFAGYAGFNFSTFVVSSPN